MLVKPPNDGFFLSRTLCSTSGSPLRSPGCTQWLLSVDSFQRPQRGLLQLSAIAFTLRALHIFRKQKNFLWNPVPLQNARIPREIRPPDSWSSGGLPSSSKNTSACYKGKAVQLAVIEVSPFPTGVNWVPCLLFWTWLNIKKDVYFQIVPGSTVGGKDTSRPAKLMLHASVLYLGKSGTGKVSLSKFQGHSFFLGLQRRQ